MVDLSHPVVTSTTSALLRLAALLSCAIPDVFPGAATLSIPGLLVPVLYILGLPGWLSATRRKPIVEEREIVQVIAGKGSAKKRAVEKANGVQIGKVKKIKYVRREGEVSRMRRVVMMPATVLIFIGKTAQGGG